MLLIYTSLHLYITHLFTQIPYIVYFVYCVLSIFFIYYYFLFTYSIFIICVIVLSLSFCLCCGSLCHYKNIPCMSKSGNKALSSPVLIVLPTIAYHTLLEITVDLAAQYCKNLQYHIYIAFWVISTWREYFTVYFSVAVTLL